MKKYIALVVAVVILGGGAYATQTWFSESYAPEIETAETAPSTGSGQATTTIAREISEEPRATQEIAVEKPEETNTAPARARHYTIPVLTESSVLEAMNAYAAQSEFSFTGREFSGLGLLVEEIGGLKNANGFYWTLYINDELSEKGVSSAHVAPGNIVEWRYQKGV